MRDFKLLSLLKRNAYFTHCRSNNRQQHCEMQLEQHECSPVKSQTVVHAMMASSLAYCSMLSLGWKLALCAVPWTRHDGVAGWHLCAVPCGGSCHLPGHMTQLQSLWGVGSRLTMENWLGLKWFWIFPDLSLAEKIHLARWRCQMRRNISFIKLITHSYVLSRSSVA